MKTSVWGIAVAAVCMAVLATGGCGDIDQAVEDWCSRSSAGIEGASCERDADCCGSSAFECDMQKRQCVRTNAGTDAGTCDASKVTIGTSCGEDADCCDVEQFLCDSVQKRCTRRQRAMNGEVCVQPGAGQLLRCISTTDCCDPTDVCRETGECTQPPPVCLGDGCVADAECCTGQCRASETLGPRCDYTDSVSMMGQACHDETDCAGSLRCEFRNGIDGIRECKPPPFRTDGFAVDEGCLHDGDCNTDQCFYSNSSRTCQAPATCSRAGGSCADATDCCGALTCGGGNTCQ